MARFYLHQAAFISTKLQSWPQMRLTDLFGILVMTPTAKTLRKKIYETWRRGRFGFWDIILLENNPESIAENNWRKLIVREEIVLKWLHCSAEDEKCKSLKNYTIYLSCPALQNDNLLKKNTCTGWVNHGVKFFIFIPFVLGIIKKQ